MATLRLFVAVPIAPVLEEGVGEILAKVAKHRSIRWVSKAQLHITLRFIGTFEESQLTKLEQGLKEAALLAEPFEAEIGGLGAFPKLDRPRVLFVLVLRGVEGFGRLEKTLSTLLDGFGVKRDEREYHPHLTLGRVGENGARGTAVVALQEACPAHWKPWRVDRFILFKSQLATGGPVYTRLQEFELGKR